MSIETPRRHGGGWRRGLPAVAVALSFAALGSCGLPAPPPPVAPSRSLAQSAPDWFGFVGVSCGVDDPHDPSDQGDYLDEVAGFTNLAHVCVFELDQREVLARVRASGARALLDVSALLFEAVPGDAPSGSGQRYQLRGDAATLWAAFVAANEQVLDPGHVAAVYLIDEPAWNGASAADLEAASALVQDALPAIPTLIVEASDALSDAYFPAEVDWVGFDRYAVADPATDPAYQADLATLRSRAGPDQRIALIMDAQWQPVYDQLGIAPADLGDIARSYAQLAAGSPDVVALIGYSWPGGIDGPDQLGARDLPAEVQAVYRSIGASVLGDKGGR